jgi:hypothetical protein
MAQLYGDQDSTGTSMVFAHAMGVTTGPCAFLTILPVTPGNSTVVSVIHCVGQYIRPATDGAAATNDSLNNRTFVFMGDCFPPQLPMIKTEPSTGIINYGQPLAMPVPNDGPTDTFYQAQENEELLPRRTATTQQDIRQVIYLSVAWIPAFIDDLPPKVAWERARILQGLMVAEDQAAFQPLVNWTKTACLKKAAAAQSGSQVAVPWREVRWLGYKPTGQLLSWHLLRLRSTTGFRRKPVRWVFRRSPRPSNPTRHGHGNGRHGTRDGSPSASPARVGRRIVDAPLTDGDP